MPSKKKTAKKSAGKKTLLQKVSVTASHIKDDIVAGKDNLVEFAGEAIDSIKEGVKHLVQKNKPKKSTKKKSIKKAPVKKTAKRSVPKKSAPRKTIKKTAKKRAVRK
jgi:hypothetical protein